ncbi:MAG TPA: hypothetical protein VHV52_07490 [Gaiellaceae bacterium]|jgi:hypothetical protein|nr:hypothetical protein [Gaiellaceae bacterium]
MRKVLFAIVGVVALVASSVAIARGVEGANTASAVSGTFSAAAGSVTTRSCTTSGGKSVTVTSGTYTGTASGDADLTGAITLRVKSVVNTTDNVGVVSGALKIGNVAQAAFASVYDGGSIAGLATGRANKTALLGNLSATFSPTTGFTSGKIGGGTAGGSAVELAPGGCQGSSSGTEHSEAVGTVSAVSSTSITVAGLTCSVGSDQASNVVNVHVGDKVTIQCTLASGGTVPALTKVGSKSQHAPKSSGSSNGTRQAAKHGKHHKR